MRATMSHAPAPFFNPSSFSNTIPTVAPSNPTLPVYRESIKSAASDIDAEIERTLALPLATKLRGVQALCHRHSAGALCRRCPARVPQALWRPATAPSAQQLPPALGSYTPALSSCPQRSAAASTPQCSAAVPPERGRLPLRASTQLHSATPAADCRRRRRSRPRACAADYYKALRPEELAVFKHNLKSAAELAGYALADITGGTAITTRSSGASSARGAAKSAAMFAAKTPQKQPDKPAGKPQKLPQAFPQRRQAARAPGAARPLVRPAHREAEEGEAVP
eukprot:TRINITY_DN19487_c0_g1_i1.p1 TRINITY_DN19487_c0_g1~~TRINITY_DN19487_c0_g1_i1.p1  ORF type:complete len:281 (+),score=31.50 TRINITY_DN19487_c0_g1_i1:1301-2143(+)